MCAGLLNEQYPRLLRAGGGGADGALVANAPTTFHAQHACLTQFYRSLGDIGQGKSAEQCAAILRKRSHQGCADGAMSGEHFLELSQRLQTK
jgi:hypothetical protein